MIMSFGYLKVIRSYYFVSLLLMFVYTAKVVTVLMYEYCFSYGKRVGRGGGWVC